MKNLGLLGVFFATTLGCGTEPADGAPGASSSDLSATQCTSTFGDRLAGQNGRLDGTVHAVVAPQHGHQCNEDASHVHVQIAMGGDVYDVAVNTADVAMVEKDMTSLPGGPWQEGWHRGAMVSYPNDLDLHTRDFAATTGDVSAQFMNDLANATQVSAYAWLYSKGGIHLVHKSRSSNADGAFVVGGANGAPSRLYAFKFDDQTF